MKKENIFHKYRKTPPLDYIADYLIGLKSKGVKEFITDYDLGFRKITKNGKLAQLQNKWADLIIINK